MWITITWKDEKWLMSLGFITQTWESADDDMYIIASIKLGWSRNANYKIYVRETEQNLEPCWSFQYLDTWEAGPPTERHIWKTRNNCIAGDSNEKDVMCVTFYLKNLRNPEGKNWVIDVDEIRHLSKSNSGAFICNSQRLGKENACSGSLVFARRMVCFVFTVEDTGAMERRIKWYRKEKSRGQGSQVKYS